MRRILCAIILVIAIPWSASAEKFEPWPALGLRIRYDSCIPLPSFTIQVKVGNCFLDTPFIRIIADVPNFRLTLVHWTTVKVKLDKEMLEEIQKMLPQKRRSIVFKPSVPKIEYVAAPLYESARIFREFATATRELNRGD